MCFSEGSHRMNTSTNSPVANHLCPEPVTVELVRFSPHFPRSFQMKIRTTVLLAAATLIIPMGASLLSPNLVEARGNRAQTVAMGGGADLTPEQRQAKRAERAAKMQEALGLSDAQAADIQAIKESYKPQFEALGERAKALKESGADREAMQPIREEMRALRDEVKAEVATVLTAEQQAKLEELKAERGDRRGGRRGGRGGRSGDANS